MAGNAAEPRTGCEAMAEEKHRRERQRPGLLLSVRRDHSSGHFAIEDREGRMLGCGR